MSAQLHTHHLRPRFPRLLVTTLTAGGIATAALATGIGSHTPAAAQAARVRTLPLSQRVLPVAALPGFVASGQPATTRSALTWASTVEGVATPMREVARLHQSGFTAGATQRFHGRFPLLAGAVSRVERFHSAAEARAEFTYQGKHAFAAGPGHQVTALRTGMPGAFGWVDRSPQLTAINVIFTSGAYLYAVKSAAAPGATGAPTPKQIVADAQFLNLLVNGCVRNAGTAKSPRTAAAQTAGTAPMLLH
jgi:hypothetical protein